MGSRRERKDRQEAERKSVAVLAAADAVTHAPTLDDFAADVLDWAEVREHLVPLANSALGRRAVQELEPRDDDGARAALARVSELVLLGSDEPGTNDLADVLPALARARSASIVLGPDDLLALLLFLKASTRLGAWLAERAPRARELGRLADGLPKLESLETMLENGIDRRGEVRDDASPRLGKLRAAQSDLTQRIERRVRAIANSADLRNVLSPGQHGTVHLRDGRAVLAVKAKSVGQVPGIVHDHSGSGETVFVEPREVIELGNELAVVRADVQREVQRLLLEWTRAALEREERIAKLADRMSELELALVGKRLCERLRSHVPDVASTTEGLVLRAARHPLLAWQVQEGRLEECVPIDVRLGEPFRILVVTGPNTGGKTLALKTAGLAALMTRLGLPFPCAPGSKVPLYRGIVADIGDEQGVEQSLSTFSASLVRIARGLPRAGPRVLFLLDELGGGTDPADGAALGAALLEWLLVRQAPTLATTHIGKLKEFGFGHPGAENASVEFDVETLRPTYRLVVGAPGESRALVIARRLGLPNDVLARAEQLVDRGGEESRRLMGEIQTARVSAERAREEAAKQHVDAALRTQDLVRAQADVAAQRALLVDELQVELERRLATVRDGLAALRKLSPQIGGTLRGEYDGALARIDASLSAASLTERRRAFVEGLRKGDFVYLPRQKKKCLVTKVDRDKGSVRVKLGNLDLEVPIDEATAFEAL
jgi:DNA mismatch repair protein MutS2